MARLIIGHTTSNSVNVWVRGSRKYPVGYAQIIGPNKNQTKYIELEERHGYTGAFKFTALKPNTEYEVIATFSHTTRSPKGERIEFGHCVGRVRTFRPKTSKAKMTFILGSCNLHTLGLFNNGDVAYRRINEEAVKADADFMIHCGDQIYFDIQIPPRYPTVEAYRRCYRDAWGDSRPARKLLTQLPHYMILDDHEIIDNFSNDIKVLGVFSAGGFKNAGIKAYREYQYIHSPRNHGNDSLHYSFNCGINEFFVLDTRSERHKERKEIISRGQMSRFKRWLTSKAKSNQFVVTSVPFVAENLKSKDKWNGFTEQRDEIIDHISKNKISKLTFLCGDQHNSMHSTMMIGDDNAQILVNEVMSSPINQIQKADRDDYDDNKSKTTSKGTKYKFQIKKFYNEHSNAMVIKVEGGKLTYTIFRTKKKDNIKSETFNL